MVRTSILTSLLAAVSTALAERRVIPGGYIFEVEDGHDAAAVIQEVGSHGTTRMHLNYKLFKGVSVQLHDLKAHKETAAKLASAPSIKRVWPIELHDLPDVTGANSKALNIKDLELGGKTDSALSRRDVMNETDTWPPHLMTQVEKLRAKGITGKGIKLAIVDTGVDYTQPALGGCFGEGCRVSFGYDLVGDHYTGSNVPVPDPDPLDCAGHGTHVTGIVAAKDEWLHFTGAAPDVTLGMYRVFGCPAVSAGDDVLIGAFNMAFEAGADIITASIGGNTGWSENAWSVAVSRIVEHGVVCTLAAGNDGRSGAFDASEAADGKGVTAIASFESTDYPSFGYPSKEYIDGGEEKVFVNAPSEAYNWTGISNAPVPIYPLSLDITNNADGCDPLPDTTPDLSGYVVLIRRGTCYFSDKASHAAAKGAKYVLFYDSYLDTTLSRYSIQNANVSAAAMIPARTGQRWVNAIKAGHNVTVLMQYPRDADRSLAFEKRPGVGGSLSTFTSWGPTWEMDMKPVVGAPGGNIWSTWVGGYSAASGTSMATPITAAILALILQVRGPTTPRMLDNLVSTTAKAQNWFDGKSVYPGDLAPVPQQGGGIVQAFDAAYTTTLLDPANLSFNDTDNFVKQHEFVITNKGSSAATYKITHVPALTTFFLDKDSIFGTRFPPEVSRDYAALDISAAEVTLQPGNRKIITVSARPPSGIDAKRLPIWSGYITINGTDGSALSLPYQGVSGSLKGSTSLGADYGYMSWSNETGSQYGNPTRAPANYTFTLPTPGTTGTGLLPMLTFNLALGTQVIRADLVPMTTCPPKNMTGDDPLGGKYKTVGQHPAFPIRLLPRGLEKAVWDGSLDSGEFAPAGRYKFVFRALRVYGDESKVEDYYVAESLPFRIEYKSS